MSKLDDMLSESKQAEQRYQKSMALIAELDRKPEADTHAATNADSASRKENDALKANNVPAVGSTALVRGNSSMTPLEDAALVEKKGISGALVRGNSSMTPLEDAGIIEECGVAMKMCGFGDQSGDPVGQQLCALAGFHPPSEHSFCMFFRTWFEFEHFPGMSDALKRELVSRAKTKGFFSGLSSQVKKFAMANADTRLQADAWHSYFIKNAPPTYKTYGCVRIACINLGAVAHPCWVRFYGLPASPDARDNTDRWVIMPWTSHDADISALVDELDGRGGMAALLEAAATK